MNKVLFKIINAYPNRRILDHPWHLGQRPVTLAVTVIRHTLQDGVFVLTPEPNTQHVDLMYWCSIVFPDVLQSARAFGQIDLGSLLVIKPSVMKKLCSTSPMQQPMLHDDAIDALALQHVGSQVLPKSAEVKLYMRLLRDLAFAEDDKFLSARSRG